MLRKEPFSKKRAVPLKSSFHLYPIIPYESQKDIYYLMLEDLANATTALTNALNNDSGINAFGSGDIIYNGDVTK